MIGRDLFLMSIRRFAERRPEGRQGPPLLAAAGPLQAQGGGQEPAAASVDAILRNRALAIRPEHAGPRARQGCDFVAGLHVTVIQDGEEWPARVNWSPG